MGFRIWIWEVLMIEAATVGLLKKGVLTNFAKFKGKHLSQSLFLSKVAALRPVTIKKVL